MTKVIYLPLDEWPCNYLYPKLLAEITDLELIVPDKVILGNKKQPADFNNVKSWIMENVSGADYLIVSIDMLVYGGIVPSRIHNLPIEDSEKRLSLLHNIKEENPSIKIFGFNLITRTPSYNNNDEEPDYYETYGSRIFNYGRLTDKQIKEGLGEKEQVELKVIKKGLPAYVLADFLNRRNVNHQINQLAINYVENEIIDHMVIPLDDHSPYETFGHDDIDIYV